MFSIWLIGFIIGIVYTIIKAGYNSDYIAKYDFDSILCAGFLTLVILIFWPLTFPLYSLYKFGQYLKKRKRVKDKNNG